MALPSFGSSMSVWNIAIMCFQLILLGGYAYVHYFPKLVGQKAYIKIHIVLLLLSVILSFILFTHKPFATYTNYPTIDVIILLLTTIGIPFFMVSTSASNFQKWYSLIFKDSPYHLYSLSNAGNLLALIGYGLVFELLFGVRHQILFWNGLYTIAVFVGVGIGIKVYQKLREDNFEKLAELDRKVKKEKIDSKLKLYWLVLSFVPSALLIATNSTLANLVNVSNIHFYWLLPLVLYLLAFIIAFSRLKLMDISFYERVTFWVVGWVLITYFISNNSHLYFYVMFALFMVGLVCNLYLVKSAPDKANLTDFYLYISFGGVLGGIFSTLIAPVIFSHLYEYLIISLIFLLILFFRHRREAVNEFVIDGWEYSMLFVIVMFIVLNSGISLGFILGPFGLFVFGILFVARKLYVSNKTRVIGLAIIFAFTFSLNYEQLKNIEYMARNFYGVKTVRFNVLEQSNKTYDIVELRYGNTNHGFQYAKGSEYEFEASGYYEREGSTIGRFFETNGQKFETVGVTGLGGGVLSNLSEEHQEWTYFEIDPQVVEIAKNPELFTLIDKYGHNIVEGDARITLEYESDNYYDVLVLDAYSGSLIPISLLTKEAVELYKQKIKEDGILLFHVSSRQFNLQPVLSTAAAAVGMNCYVDKKPSIGKKAGISSFWIMMTNNEELVSEDWTEIDSYEDFRLWTDDRHSIITVLR